MLALINLLISKLFAAKVTIKFRVRWSARSVRHWNPAHGTTAADNWKTTHQPEIKMAEAIGGKEQTASVLVSPKDPFAK